MVPLIASTSSIGNDDAISIDDRHSSALIGNPAPLCFLDIASLRLNPCSALPVIIEPGESIVGFLDDCGSEHPAIRAKIKMVK
jgi:hypothetical protein